jgi:hypothetical protein
MCILRCRPDNIFMFFQDGHRQRHKARGAIFSSALADGMAIMV